MLHRNAFVCCISTSLVQVFVCDRFDNGSFLRAQLTLACNSSDRRLSWAVFSAIALIAYPLGVPAMIFVLLRRNRHSVQKLGTTLAAHNATRGTGLNVRQLAKTKQGRGSFATLSVELRWLRPKFERYLPTRMYASVCLLTIRLLQTSFLALVRTQKAQAIIMCFVTLAALVLQSELSPYRRASDNHIALYVQALIFVWSFVLLLRVLGMFEREATAVVTGVVLCMATVTVFVTALVLANADRLSEERAERQETEEEIELPTLNNKNTASEENESEQTQTTLDQEVEAGPSPSLPWSLLVCGEGGAEEADAATTSTGQIELDELARFAIAAGVKRSEVSRLADAISTRLTAQRPS